MKAEILTSEFYARGAVEVARDLIGCVLVRRLDRQGVTVMLAGRIVETEAYRSDDPASHSYGGRTARNAAMFGPAGHTYVYRSYGVHWCLNVVTGFDGIGEAVLLRALEPLEGLDMMAELRGNRAVRALCAGPGRLCAALGITGELNGVALTGDPIGIFGPPSARPCVVSSARVGITKGRDLNWRFCDAESAFLSRPCSSTGLSA